jgi:hypothetical protein
MPEFFPLKNKALRSVIAFAFSLIAALFCSDLSAQSVPSSINYQAVLRDAESMAPLSDAPVYLVAEYLSGPNGEVLYQEEFSTIQSGRGGLINIPLGSGNPLVRTFEEISWQDHNVWLRISVDTGSGLTILQETPFRTVPYAFYAQRSAGDEDADPTNEIQSLSLEGAELSISGIEDSIDLSLIPDFGPDADADPNNELQNLQLNNNQLTLTNTPTTSGIDLSPYLDNTDEQTLSLDENNILNISGVSSPVDLNILMESVEEADGDPNNEIQDLFITDDHMELFITNNDDATTIDLSPFFDNTDSQELNLDGTELSISGAGATIDLSSLPGLGDDADANPENELQDLSLSGNTLSLSDDATPVDLSGYLDNTDSQDLTLVGTTLSLTGDATPVDLSGVPGIGDDADTDPENELQNLQLLGNALSLTNVTPSTQIDMSQYDQSDLSQGRIFVGNAANEASEVEISGDVVLADNGETTVTAIQGTEVSATPPNAGQVLWYNGSEGEWQPRSPGAIINEISTSYYSVDPLDFRELADPNIGVDLDNHNAIKFFDDEAPFVMLRNANIREVMAPIHLPHGATINNVKVYFRNSSSTFMSFILSRKELSSFSSSNEVMANIFHNTPSGDLEQTSTSIFFPEIDNQNYSYRLFVRFDDLTTQDAPSLDQVEQRVYGAVIEYTTN